MIECVLDASVVATWMLGNPADARTIAASALIEARGERAIHAPEFLVVEVANALWKAVRFAGLDVRAASRSIDALPHLGLQLHPNAPLAAAALELACRKTISAYDASYVVLARSLRLPLVTADLKLVRSMAAADVVPLA